MDYIYIEVTTYREDFRFQLRNFTKLSQSWWTPPFSYISQSMKVLKKNYNVVLISILFWNFFLFLQSNPDDLPKYVYEITTTSFIVDENGFLVVNQPNLDRDPPNESRLSFRVFVRELLNDDPKSSRPLTITVNLKDVNDNAPILEPVRDISLVAGNTKRNIATVSKNFLFSFKL